MYLSLLKLLHTWVLTATIFIPLVGAVIVLFIPKSKVQLIRNFSLLVSSFTFLVSLVLFRWYHFEPSAKIFQFVMRREWIREWGINYTIGIDGISLLLILLTTFLTPLVIWSTYKAIDKYVKEFMFFMLLLETAMIGTFAALNLFLFYIFWELMLVPMYFIIGVWGGERRIYAAIKFFLFTMVGSVLMLVAILVLAWMNKEQTAVISFEYADFLRLNITHLRQLVLFLAFGLAFAIKVPMFPFHTWLPDAHVEAPTSGSVILAGVLLKMGTYGLLRFCIPLFPKAAVTFMPHMMTLAVIGIIYGALVSMVQPDLKKLVAYSSVSHLGFVVLGMFAMTSLGIQGSVLQMINHGLSTGALFLLVGVVYERRHTRLIAEFGGLAKVMPIFGTVFMIVMLSSVGLPGLNGFIGEFLILVGTYTSQAHPWTKIYAALGATGVIFAAGYLLWMYQRVMFGPVKNPKNEGLPDLSARELLIFLPILLFIFWIGIYPRTFTKRLEPSIDYVVKRVQSVMPFGTVTPGEKFLSELELQGEEEGESGAPQEEVKPTEESPQEEPAVQPAPSPQEEVPSDVKLPSGIPTHESEQPPAQPQGGEGEPSGEGEGEQ